MNEIELSIIYKALTIILSGIIVYWGYRLFIKGYSTAAGDISAFWGDKKIILRSVTPGIFFSLIGGVGFIISVSKGIDLNSAHKKNSQIEAPKPALYTQSTFDTLKQNLNIDSIYSIGIKEDQNKHYLEAYKYFLLVKGFTLKDSTIKFENLNKNIQSTYKKILGSIQPYPIVEYEENSRSVKINQEDTLK